MLASYFFREKVLQIVRVSLSHCWPWLPHSRVGRQVPRSTRENSIWLAKHLGIPEILPVSPAQLMPFMHVKHPTPVARLIGV
jgi:hypothetical protein